ncbi:CDGSH iron-sulfur domain-containing protein [Flavobacterium hiemivividum]|uniref:CDGSH iron-sulfur domain-containing protein n=1 Tax=Flavobacterium hiemivividum TaxID=2541734 RepID=A0A4R5CZ12_9FLAO|nr:CDGSH iron-sulfur domain-containing protein [Flavobacterium hiemivividum]TDE06142.1 CDGSH iron-sulfur domain-containing protein [Flavobacterium hiemivividum]
MSKTKLIINNNGSIKIEGDFEILDCEGKVYGLEGRTALGLCRCGQSVNKPFCDGSHRNSFDHESKAFDLPPMKAK